MFANPELHKNKLLNIIQSYLTSYRREITILLVLAVISFFVSDLAVLAIFFTLDTEVDNPDGSSTGDLSGGASGAGSAAGAGGDVAGGAAGAGSGNSVGSAGSQGANTGGSAGGSSLGEAGSKGVDTGGNSGANNSGGNSEGSSSSGGPGGGGSTSNIPCDGGNFGGCGSTPFLLTHNGHSFIHENDFLFGKPNTAFTTFEQGYRSYKAGIGGDTYLIQNPITPDKEGNIKLEIREIEPEESFIDTFSLHSLDLKANEHFVVDGNLKDSYIFDTNTTIVPKDQHLTHFHKATHSISSVNPTYTTLTPEEGTSTTLATDDILSITIPKDQLNPNTDTFILVDSHFRDWTLGEAVPFSTLERFEIQSRALAHKTLTTISGTLLMLAGTLGAVKADGVTSTTTCNPRVYDIYGTLVSYPPHCPDTTTPTTNTSQKSLIISAGDSFAQSYLETLFPRFIQASQEVVRIPKDLINNLKDNYLTVRITATKTHKVRSAFVFQGTPETPVYHTLEATTVTHQRTGQDHKDSLKNQDHHFLHTIPGDRISLTFKDTARTPETTRRYFLKATGFYTRMSPQTASLVGPHWLSRLSKTDRSLLKHLKSLKA